MKEQATKMAGSFTGQMLARALINGSLNASQLEDLITTDTLAGTYFGAARELVKSGTMGGIFSSQQAFNAMAGAPTLLPYLLAAQGQLIAASDALTGYLAGNATAMAEIMDSSTLLDYWTAIPANKTRIQGFVNQPGSVLYRAVYTATQAITWPNLIQGSYAELGPGGNGGGATGGNNAGSGGSGGEAKFGILPSLPTPGSSVTITVPTSPGTATSIGALVTAASGLTGDSNITTGGAKSGGGTTAGQTCYDTALLTAVAQPRTGSKQGGNGGAVSGYPSGSGTAGLTGSGGAGATANNAPGRAQPGTGYGSGAGAGASGGTGEPGVNAVSTDYGSAGSGGGQDGVSAGPGGNGAGGLAVIYGVLAAPAA